MTATVRGLADIRRELLSWGRHAKVIDPPELRQAMAEEARAMAAVYGRAANPNAAASASDECFQ
jgi:predicted DNA-binding transcriptional regulator YafY